MLASRDFQYPAKFLHFLQSENIGSPDGDPINVQKTEKHDRFIFIIYLQSECIEKHQFELCSKYNREYGFDVILGYVVLCRKLRWVCHKHSSDVARQVETPSKRTTFVVRHDFHVALVVTLYHDCKTSKYCNRYRCVFSLTTCEVLRHAASFFSAFVYYKILNP